MTDESHRNVTDHVAALMKKMTSEVSERLQWTAFEPNDEPCWSRVRQDAGDVLMQFFERGELVGNTSREAFFVKCDRTTMSQDDVDAGRLICLIGVAPLRPAEFEIVRIEFSTA
jgi:phage tail sheath protein FI